MSFSDQYLKPFLLPWVLFITVAFMALFTLSARDWFLPVLFLLLPFVDSRWRLPATRISKRALVSWSALISIIFFLLYKKPELVNLFVVMTLLAALPEEWFFRSYLQKRLGNNITAVIVVSVLFALMHFITHDSAVVWLVFFPSIFFGWLYKKSDDLLLIVLIHALSNLIYYIYLQTYIEDFLANEVIHIG